MILILLETKKIREATKTGKIIVHEGWLDFCMLFFCYIREKDYLLSAESPRVDVTKLNQSYVFNQNKENIEEFYSIGNEELKNFFDKINAEVNNDNIDTNKFQNSRNRKKESYGN